MTKRLQKILIAPILLTAACVDPYYSPTESSTTEGFLVVDGYVDAVARTGTVKLKRSILLGEVNPPASEANASVTIEDEAGHSVTLNEVSEGTYSSVNLDLSATSKYTLHIRTNDGAKYSSDPIDLKRSPSFDSVVWRTKEDGVHFYVNAHDEHNTTRYYHYRFTEAWEYRVPFVSHYILNQNGFPVKRKDNQLVAFCWSAVDATSVLVKSTTSLSRDIVDMFEIKYVKKGSRRLAIRYGLLVQQRAISPEEFSFLDQLDRSSESLGGLFDPIPGQVTGNVHNDNNPDEPVLGYFSGGFPSEKLIFITYDDLPKDLQVLDPFEFECSVQVVSLNQLGANIILELENPVLNQYYVSSNHCSDCRTLGGDTLKPKFWPQ